MPAGEPLLRVDEKGHVTRRIVAATRGAEDPTRLRVLAYRVRQQRLIQADVSFWFLKLKGPAASYALRDTGFDVERLGLTIDELEELGPCVVLDETTSNGDRLLAWTE